MNRMPFDSHCIDDKVLLDKSSDITSAINVLKSHGKRTVLSAYPHVSERTRNLFHSTFNIGNSRFRSSNFRMGQ